MVLPKGMGKKKRKTHSLCPGPRGLLTMMHGSVGRREETWSFLCNILYLLILIKYWT